MSRVAVPLVSVAALLLLQGCSAVSVGQLRPSSFVEQKSQAFGAARLLPHSHSNHHEALSYPLPKYTPGDACGVHDTCHKCLVNQVCVWLPFTDRCVEDRDPQHMLGTMQCNSWTPDLLPVVQNEFDDYRLFHTRNDPRDFNIATLNGGQDVFGLAVDLEGRAPNDPDHALAKNGGGEIINGLTHAGFTGSILEHKNGHMLPIGVQGDESRLLKKTCNCKHVKFAAKDCDCGIVPEPL